VKGGCLLGYSVSLADRDDEPLAVQRAVRSATLAVLQSPDAQASTRMDHATLPTDSSMRSQTAWGWEASEAWFASSSIVLRGFIRCAMLRSLSG
jgi:hypothetical protein